MIKKLMTEIFTRLREDAGLTQTDLGLLSALSRRRVQRVEKGERLPTEEEEEAILVATDSTRLSLVELICKALSDELGRRVTIVAEEVGYQAATPEGELAQLMALAYEKKMPRDRWWVWKERVGRLKTLAQVYEVQGYADVRDLSAEVEALCRQEEAEMTEAAEEGKPTRQKGEDSE